MSCPIPSPETAHLRRQLSAVPVRNALARPSQQQTTGAGIAVVVPIKYPQILRKLGAFLPLSGQRTFLVEGRGREIYELIDGTRSVETIIDRFRAPHALTFFEGRALVLAYLATLTKNGLVAAMLDDSSRAPILSQANLRKSEPGHT